MCFAAACPAIFALIVAVVCASQREERKSGPSDYVGSAACQRCHDTEYTSWRRTLHVQMTKPIAEALVEGAFGDERPPRPVRQRRSPQERCRRYRR